MEGTISHLIFSMPQNTDYTIIVSNDFRTVSLLDLSFRFEILKAFN